MPTAGTRPGGLCAYAHRCLPAVQGRWWEAAESPGAPRCTAGRPSVHSHTCGRKTLCLAFPGSVGGSPRGCRPHAGAGHAPKREPPGRAKGPAAPARAIISVVPPFTSHHPAKCLSARGPVASAAALMTAASAAWARGKRLNGRHIEKPNMSQRWAWRARPRRRACGVTKGARR